MEQLRFENCFSIKHEVDTEDMCGLGVFNLIIYCSNIL